MKKFSTLTKKMYGLTVAMGMLDEKISKARKNGETEVLRLLKNEYDGLFSEYARFSLQRAVCGDDIVVA